MIQKLNAGNSTSNAAQRRRPTSCAILVTLATLIVVTAAACKKAPVIEKGSAVKINYTLKVDGNVIDSSVGKEPLPYVAGSGQIIPGLDEQLMGLKKGDKKLVTVTPEKGYGVINPQAIQKIPKKSFGDTKGLKVGGTVTGQQNGRMIQAKIAAIGDKDISLDMNHPLAGKTLNFDIEVVEVTPAGKGQAGR